MRSTIVVTGSLILGIVAGVLAVAGIDVMGMGGTELAGAGVVLLGIHEVAENH